MVSVDLWLILLICLIPHDKVALIIVSLCRRTDLKHPLYSAPDVHTSVLNDIQYRLPDILQIGIQEIIKVIEHFVLVILLGHKRHLVRDVHQHPGHLRARQRQRNLAHILEFLRMSRIFPAGGTKAFLTHMYIHVT